jgi:hypothetical protein
MEGFLTKKGHNYKTWKRRYMVFNAEERELYYYASELMQKLKGRIKVNAVFDIPDRVGARPFRIDFQASDGTITATSAESLQMKQQWIDVVGQTVGGLAEIDAHPRKQALQAKAKEGKGVQALQGSRFGSELGGGSSLSSSGNDLGAKCQNSTPIKLDLNFDLKQVAVLQAIVRGMIMRRRYGVVAFEATRLVVKQMKAFADVLFQGIQVVEFPDADGGGVGGPMQRVLFLREDGSLTLATYALSNEGGRAIPLHRLEVVDTSAAGAS